VRRGARVLLGKEVGDRSEGRLFHHVIDAEPDLEAAVGILRHRSDDERVRKTRAPFAVVDRRVLVGVRRERRDLEAAEQAASFKIGAHDAGQARAGRVLTGERHDRDGGALYPGACNLDRELRPGAARPDQKNQAEQQFCHLRQAGLPSEFFVADRHPICPAGGR
jgi:hypothetical protein